MKKKGFITVFLFSSATAIQCLAAPAPPDQIKLMPRNGVMEITWLKSPDDPLNVSGYEVVRGVFPTGPFQSVCVTVKSAVSCTDRSARPEKTYYYKARALGFADDGHSPFTVSVRGELPPPEIPADDRMRPAPSTTATGTGSHR